MNLKEGVLNEYVVGWHRPSGANVWAKAAEFSYTFLNILRK